MYLKYKRYHEWERDNIHWLKTEGAMCSNGTYHGEYSNNYDHLCLECGGDVYRQNYKEQKHRDFMKVSEFYNDQNIRVDNQHNGIVVNI